MSAEDEDTNCFILGNPDVGTGWLKIYGVLSLIEQQLISARLALTNSQTTMARLIRVAPGTELRARKDDCLERLSVDAQTVINQAIATRPELHALIQQANQQRMAANLAKLDYVPDPTFGATWIGIANDGISPVTNGDDAVLLNVSMNLPIYRSVSSQ